VILIMPHIEQEAAYKLYQNWGGTDSYNSNFPAPGTGTFPRYGSAPNTTNVTGRRYKVLSCPADKDNNPIGAMTNCNYAVNVGNTGNAQQSTLNGVAFRGAPFQIAQWTGTSSKSPSKTYRNTLQSIQDGTSNTLLVGEVKQGQGSDLRGFIWWGDATGFTTYLGPNSSTPDVVYTPGYCQNNPQANLPCTGTPTSTNPSMFGSRSNHPGGVNAGFGDGSVRFVRQSVVLANWRAMSTTEGGEVISND
jgi:prepilin-type processing-associated H-X9-DG protein